MADHDVDCKHGRPILSSCAACALEQEHERRREANRAIRSQKMFAKPNCLDCEHCICDECDVAQVERKMKLDLGSTERRILLTKLLNAVEHFEPRTIGFTRYGIGNWQYDPYAITALQVEGGRLRRIIALREAQLRERERYIDELERKLKERKNAKPKRKRR